MEKLAVGYNINIVGGSHPTRVEGGDIRNIAYVFLRDGSVHRQAKLHPTPSERRWWNIKGGYGADAINTDCGPIGVMICSDSEFPELARHLVNQRSEEHTSELQSLMRISYAVVCLKKKQQ